MSTDDTDTLFKSNLFFLLDELFEGPPAEASGTVALDRNGNFRDSLKDLSAADASRAPFAGATTVAAHVIHTTYYMTNMLRYLTPGGDTTSRADWPGSWARSVVTAAEWDAARAALFAAQVDLRKALAASTDWSGDRFADAMAPLFHGAYHLGAVRQLIKALKA